MLDLFLYSLVLALPFIILIAFISYQDAISEHKFYARLSLARKMRNQSLRDKGLRPQWDLR